MNASAPVGDRRGGSERPALSREQIVTTAISLVDAEGVSALSMRRLGSEMGVEAMALYRYVDGREDLLDAMVDAVTAPVEHAAGADVQHSGGWRPYLWRLAYDMRDLALRHPNVFPLVATRHPVAPWLRPPLRNLDVVEELLLTLRDAGFTVAQTAVIYRTFASFLLGHLLLTAAQESTQGSSGMPTSTDGSGASSRDLDEFPTIASMSALLSESDKDAEEFEAGLEDLLDRIAQAAGEPHDPS